jgi:hypothetical protein
VPLDEAGKVLGTVRVDDVLRPRKPCPERSAGARIRQGLRCHR